MRQWRVYQQGFPTRLQQRRLLRGGSLLWVRWQMPSCTITTAKAYLDGFRKPRIRGVRCQLLHRCRLNRRRILQCQQYMHLRGQNKTTDQELFTARPFRRHLSDRAKFIGASDQLSRICPQRTVCVWAVIPRYACSKAPAHREGASLPIICHCGFHGRRHSPRLRSSQRLFSTERWRSEQTLRSAAALAVQKHLRPSMIPLPPTPASPL